MKSTIKSPKKLTAKAQYRIDKKVNKKGSKLQNSLKKMRLVSEKKMDKVIAGARPGLKTSRKSYKRYTKMFGTL
jgi:hypothetical protein